MKFPTAFSLLGSLLLLTAVVDGSSDRPSAPSDSTAQTPVVTQLAQRSHSLFHRGSGRREILRYTVAPAQALLA